MWKTFSVALDERVVVLKDGLPVRALGPGRHTVWGFGLDARRWSTESLVFQMPPALRATLPAEWWSEITVGTSERVILWRDGRPVMFLGPGIHCYWEVDDSVRVQVLSVTDPMPELTAELVSILPRGAYVDVTVRELERGLMHVRGKVVQVLAPGRYAFWSTSESPVDIEKVDVRSQQATLTGQELMTKDKVTLRLSLTVEYAIEDPALAIHGVVNVRDAIYLLVQLASRQFVAGVTLDDLLSGRDGEMKTLLNKVIEAEKEAAANVILRREETAATRSLANTAKLMAEQPLLLRLKELDSLREMASKIHEIKLVVGAANGHGVGGMTSALLPSGFLENKPE